MRASREQTAQCEPSADASRRMHFVPERVRAGAATAPANFVGIVGVDMVLDELDSRMASLQRASAVALLVVLILSVLPATWRCASASSARPS